MNNLIILQILKIQQYLDFKQQNRKMSQFFDKFENKNEFIIYKYFT